MFALLQLEGVSSYVGTVGQTQVDRFDGNHFYLLSLLASPNFIIFFIFMLLNSHRHPKVYT